MKLKVIALLLCVLLAAGCGAASSQGDTGASSPGESASQSEADYVPSYTYVNPAPETVLITSPGGDITYEHYRLYLDVNEQMSRMIARQSMGVCAALEKDFADMGIEIDEEAYEASASQELLGVMMSTPSFSESLEQISDETGMTQEQVTEAMMLSFRTPYLVQLLGNHYQQLAAEELDQADASSGAASESADEAEQATRDQAIYDRAMEMLRAYSDAYETRLDFENDSALVTLDGEAIPYADKISRYMDYAGIANRIDAAAFIQAGELALRELERRETEFDRTNFETTLEQYVAGVRSDEQAMRQLTKICHGLGATVDDYFKVLERPLWLQEVGDLYYLAMTEEYGTLADGSEQKTDSSDSYYVQELGRLLEGSEIVNITGK